MTTTHTTPRIRWYGHPADRDPAFAGSVGTVDPSVFQIYAPDRFAPQWILTTSLTGMEDKRSFADTPDALKADAERWLSEFISSLGAIFGDDVAADLRSRADELEMMVDRRPGQERDNLLFSAGLKRAADLIEHGDQPMVGIAVDEPATEAQP